MKIGLALGGGAARGLAHIGVIKILERENIPIDLIAGTSMGALVGALYAQGRTSEELEEIATGANQRKITSLLDLTFPRSGLISGNKITQFIKELFGELDFSQLKIPFISVATDIMTGEEVIINKGKVFEATRASISVPVVFTPFKKSGRYLVDGGLTDSVPVGITRQMGADLVIAVNVMPRLNKKDTPVILEGEDIEPDTSEPNIFNIIMRIINISSNHLTTVSLSQADVIIEPELSSIGLTQFGHAAEAIRLGAEAAEKAIPKIKEKMAG